MPKLNFEELQKRRWLRALEIARILFDDEGYFDDYLRQIKQFIQEKKGSFTVLEIRAEADRASQQIK